MPRTFLKAREPFSSYSHFIGAVLSGVGLLAMLLRLLLDDAVSGQLAAAAVVFCLSLIALYSASSIYHFSGRGEAVVRRLKKLDHSMIYVLIAGSYTPILLRYMPRAALLYLPRRGLADCAGRHCGQAALDPCAAPDRHRAVSGARLGDRVRFRGGAVHARAGDRAACGGRAVLHGGRRHLYRQTAQPRAGAGLS